MPFASRAVAVLVFLSSMATLPPLASADEPSTRIAFVAGGRANLGAMADRYGFGYLLGGEAAFQPSILGLSWSVLFGNFASTSKDNIDPTLTTLEMDFSLRTRLALGGEDGYAFVALQGGVTLMRTSTPIVPDDRRTYFGPVAAASLEFFAGDYVVGLGVRYGMFTTGPDSVTMLLSFGAGSPGR